MDAAEIRLCLLLHGIPDLPDSELARLLLRAGSPAQLATAPASLTAEWGLPERRARSLQRGLSPGGAAFDVDAQAAALDALGADILPITDARYPPLLRAIHDPPPLLYLRGDAALLAGPQLAVVGSRRASPAGVRAAGALAAEACYAGLHITSGLARGIDGAAHQAALEAGGRSIAVVATGIDVTYPVRHRRLADALADSGCLVTEFPPGMQPLKQNFPRRNRLISGLALGVLVVEAALPSGSLITARTALEQGREVFALPWSIYHAQGRGCLQLIRDGAKMVETVADVIEELGSLFALQRSLRPAAAGGDRPAAQLSPDQRRVLEAVGFELASLDELVLATALRPAQVLAELAMLEVRGLVARQPGGYIRA